MCNHKFKDNITRHCNWDIVFSEKQATKLPHDSKGGCIFHSGDLQWKRDNNFTKWLIHLISILDKNDNTDDVIELDDIILVGDTLLDNLDQKYKFRTNANDDVYCALFKKILCGKYIVLRNATCKDPIIMERCFFKLDLILTDCIFLKGIFVNHLTIGQDLQILNCHFKNNIVTDSNNTIYDSWYINNSIFDGDISFSGITINDRSIIDDNTFSHVTSNTNFNCCFRSGIEFRNNKSTSLGFDNCNFYYDSIFCDLELSGPFQMTQPKIGGHLKFIGNERKILFNSETTIEIDIDSFEENGLVTFDYCNLIDLGTVFITNCRELEAEEKIRILPSCKVERLTVMHVYKPCKELNSNIIEDMAHIVTRYFRHWHSIDLSVNIIRNWAESWIKVVFKTTDNISEEKFNSLLHEFPTTVCTPSDNSSESEDIKRAFISLIYRLSNCKNISDSEKTDILTLNFTTNIMTENINLEQSQVGLVVSGTGHNIQGNNIKQTYQSCSTMDFNEIKKELEKLEQEVRNNPTAGIINIEQLEKLKEAGNQKNETLLMQYLKMLPGAFLKFTKDIGANLLAGLFLKAIEL